MTWLEEEARRLGERQCNYCGFEPHVWGSPKQLSAALRDGTICPNCYLGAISAGEWDCRFDKLGWWERGPH